MSKNFDKTASKQFLHWLPEAHTHREEGQDTRSLLSDFISQKWMVAGSDQGRHGEKELKEEKCSNVTQRVHHLCSLNKLGHSRFET